MTNQNVSAHKPERVAFDAMLAMKQLEQARRDACNEINGRVRKLRDLIDALQSAHMKQGEEMFEVASTLAPDIAALLSNPLRGL